MSSLVLILESWGTAHLNLEEVLKQKLVKHSNCFTKTLECFWPVYKDSTEDKEEIAEIRLIIYLEDYGPEENFKKAEKRIEEEILKEGLHLQDDQNVSILGEIDEPHQVSGLNPRGIY